MDEIQINQKFIKTDKGLCNESLKLIIKSALVEKFREGDERPCSINDFPEAQKKSREKIISHIQIILQNFLDSTSNQNCCSDIENELLAFIIILCGQNESLHPWNTAIAVKTCELISIQVISLCNCKNMSEVITKNHKNNLIKVIFEILCTDLAASTWKYFPASVTCFKWILEMIKQPDLSQYLQFVLPPALLLTDDYINENKITGIRCLKHVVQNITSAELQFYGQGNVIFSALIPLLRIRESELLWITIPVLITLTAKLEFNFKKNDLRKWSRFDDILEIFLENMELEQVTELRNCYINNIGLLVTAADFGILRWSKKLLRIFKEYIQTAKKYADEKTVNLCLKVIKKYIDLSNEMVFLYAENLLSILVHALLFDGSGKSKLQEENEKITVVCIKKLLKSLSESEREHLKSVLQGKFFCNVNFEL